MAKGSEYVNSVPPEIKVGLCLFGHVATRTCFKKKINRRFLIKFKKMWNNYMLCFLGG